MQSGTWQSPCLERPFSPGDASWYRQNVRSSRGRNHEHLINHCAETTYGLHDKAEGYAVRPRYLLGEVEDTDDLVGIVGFKLFSWYLL